MTDEPIYEDLVWERILHHEQLRPTGLSCTPPQGEPPSGMATGRGLIMGRRSKPKFTPEWEWITPTAAAVFLDHLHPDQRNVKGQVVAKYAGAMTRGEWHPTHQGIAVDTNGYTIDGHQRLTSIIRSGEPQWILVARDVPEEVMVYIDEGSKRSAGDYFRFRGQGTSATNAAAFAALMWRYRTQRFASAQAPTNDQLWEVWMTEPGIENSLAPGALIARKINDSIPPDVKSVLAPSVAMVGHYLTLRSCTGENAALGVEFLDGIRDGLGLGHGRVRGAGDPRLVFREAMRLGHRNKPNLDLGLDSVRLGSQYRSRTILSAWSYALSQYIDARPIRNSENAWGGVGPDVGLLPFDEQLPTPSWVATVELDDEEDDNE